ncbi:hypothetical protein Ade02nite_88580 [Paractinoplanes deccanensis]|uniref:Uncharacterized protein n=1 Tax=Paractinoplanes deccanensis TaxID=113561 RepID=A0ABQ3YJP7_9ACTN|nr:hypothetical protein Ade02nite_88580 [Actinoplanes deccanensis]
MQPLGPVGPRAAGQGTGHLYEAAAARRIAVIPAAQHRNLDRPSHLFIVGPRAAVRCGAKVASAYDLRCAFGTG